MVRAPEGHPRRCQARLKRRGGVQCGRWALKTSNHCQFHGGRTREARGVVRTDHLPSFYSKALGGALSDLVASCLGEAPHEQLQLFEELQLMRVLAADTVTLWTAAKGCTGENAPQMQANASALMCDALNQVRGMGESAARVYATSKGVVNVHDLALVVKQVVRIAHEVLEDEPELAAAFEKQVREEVRVSDETRGTTCTPDADVKGMDGTVPG